MREQTPVAMLDARSRPTVLHLLRRLKVGGASTLVRERVAVLQSVEFRHIVCSVIAPSSDHKTISLIQDLEDHGAVVQSLDHRGAHTAIAAAARLRRACQRQDVRLIHATLPLAEGIAAFSTLFDATPVVCDLVTTAPRQRGIGANSWRRAAYLVKPRLRYVAVSHAARRVHEPLLRGRRIEVIYPPFDASHVTSTLSGRALRRQLGLPEQGAIVLCVARLERGKGQKCLVSAMPDLLRQVPEAHLILAGDGTLQASLVEQIRDLGLGARVRLLGPRNDVDSLLDAADVAVSASEAEGLVGYSTLEALAAGKPVVAPNIPSVNEVLQHRRDALLVDPRDPKAIASAIAELLLDVPLSKTLAHAGHQKIVNTLAPSRARAQLLSLYSDLMFGRSRR